MTYYYHFGRYPEGETFEWIVKNSKEQSLNLEIL